MITKTTQLLLTISLVFFGTRVFACVCMGGGTKEYFENSEAIFSGVVTEFTSVDKNSKEWVAAKTFVNDYGRFPFTAGVYDSGHEGIQKAVFRINKTWKGSQQGSVDVFTSTGAALCGVDFIVGHEYLVYAKDSNGQLLVSKCGGTKDILDGAGEDVEYLNNNAPREHSTKSTK